MQSKGKIIKSSLHIVTFYNGLNVGGWLQAFALRAYLQNAAENCAVTFLRSPGRSLFVSDFVGGLKRKNPMAILMQLIKGFNFWSSIASLPSTKNIESGSVLVYGSDIIWNTQRLTSEEVNFYTGADVKNKKVSYAASLGQFDEEAVFPTQAAEALKKFTSISVRDEKSKRMISSMLSNHTVEIVPDPTILVGQSFWVNLAGVKTGFRKKPYCAVYSYLPETAEFLRNNNEQILSGKDIVSIGYYFRSPFLKLIRRDFVSPLQWLKYINHSEGVITSTFHGVVFSIIFNRPFIYLKNNASVAKVESLLEFLEIKNAIFESSDCPLSFPSFDWKGINDKLERFGQHGKSYIGRALAL